MSQTFSFNGFEHQFTETAAFLMDREGEGELAFTLEITVGAPRPGLFRLDDIYCEGLTAIDQLDGARLHGHVEDEDDEAYEAAYGDSTFPLALRGEDTSGFWYDDDDDSFFRLTGLKLDIAQLPTGGFRMAGSFEAANYDSRESEAASGTFAVETECSLRDPES